MNYCCDKRWFPQHRQRQRIHCLHVAFHSGGRCCALLLERGWGKAPQPHTGDDGSDIRITIHKMIEPARTGSRSVTH